MVLKLARFIQLHPGLRYFRSRHKKAVVVVFLVFLAFFFLRDRESSSPPTTHWASASSGDSDDVIHLKAQIGYLRNKLFSLGHPVELNEPHWKPVIYVITPTYRREVQKAELTRLCHAFLLVPNLHWIVVEDRRDKSSLVNNFLRSCGVAFTHLSAVTPTDMQLSDTDQHWRKPRGVVQRNEALAWIREHVTPSEAGGVVYFADDDNTYSVELFEEMRRTKKVGVWPVGLVGGLMVEKPRLSSDGDRVVGWDVVWGPHRQFAVDMAGFAVNLQLLLSKPKAKFSYGAKRGHQESEFLKQLVSLDELEPLAEKCTKVLVWHTRTEKVDLAMEEKRKERGDPLSNAFMEV